MDQLTFVGHATSLVRLSGTAVLTDPVAARWIGPLRRQGKGPAAEPFEQADVVVISHLHRDHLDLRTLRRLPPSTPLIVPRGAGALASRAGGREIIELEVGERAVAGDLTITAVPAVHEATRDRWGPRAEPIGYLLESPRRRAYFAGDTDLFEEMAELAPLDLALLPVWGWGPRLGSGHLDPDAAAWALTLLRPAVAVPVHWGTFYPAGLRRLLPRHLVEPPERFAAAATALAPEVTVRVLRPGEQLQLDGSLSAVGRG